MSRVIFKMEIKRNRLSLMLWCLLLAGIVFMGLMFYPVIGMDGVLSEMDVLMNQPLMKSMLRAFGASVESLTSLPGFFMTYNSIWSLLLGAIFAMLIGYRILANEERERTGEFLYTKPVSRKEIVTAKFGAMIVLIAILNMALCGAALLGLEFLKGNAPLQLALSKQRQEQMMQAFEQSPERVSDHFELTKEKFYDGLFIMIRQEMAAESSQAVLEEEGLSPETLGLLLSELQESPDTFLENVLNSPEKYMSMFGIPEEQKQDFIDQINTQKEEQKAAEKDYFSGGEMFRVLFSYSPGEYLSRYKDDPSGLARMFTDFGLPAEWGNQLFGPYFPERILVLSVYSFLMMAAMGGLSFLISSIPKRGRLSIAVPLGLAMSSYIIDALSKISPKIEWIGFFSLFKYVDTEITELAYGFQFVPVIILTGVIILTFAGSQIVYRRKDIYV